MAENNRSNRGFASIWTKASSAISPARAAKAFRPRNAVSHGTHELAAEAGRKGGESVPAEKRSFSRDRAMNWRQLPAVRAADPPRAAISLVIVSGPRKPAARAGKPRTAIAERVARIADVARDAVAAIRPRAPARTAARRFEDPDHRKAECRLAEFSRLDRLDRAAPFRRAHGDAPE